MAEKTKNQGNTADISLMGNLPIGYAEILPNSDMTLIRANRLFYDVIGFAEEDLKIKYGNRLFLIIEAADMGIIRTTVMQAVGEKRETVKFSFHTTAYHNTLLFTVYGRIIYNENGEPVQINCVCVNETGYDVLRNELKTERQYYAIAMKQAKIEIWEYYVAEKRMVGFDPAESGKEHKHIFEDVPWSLINSRLISEKSVPDVIEAYNKLAAGEPHVEFTCGIRYSVVEPYKWKRMVCMTIFDSQKKPERVIGVSTDISREIKKRQEAMLEEKYAAFMSDDVIMSCKCNVTSGKILFYSRRHSSQMTESEQLKLSKVVSAEIPNMPYINEREIFIKTLSQDFLLNEFNSGNNVVTLDYRRTLTNGRIVWVRLSVLLHRDSDSNDVIAFSYLREIDKRKKKELTLNSKITREGLSGHYDKKTFSEMMLAVTLDKEFYFTRAAMTIIRIDKYPAIISSYGFDAAEKITAEIGHLLTLRYRSKFVIGQLRNDIFAIFITEHGSREYRSSRLRELQELVKKPYMVSDIVPEVTLSTVTAYPERDTDYLQLLEDTVSFADAQGKNGSDAQYLIDVEHKNGETSSQEVQPNIAAGKRPAMDSEAQMIFIRATSVLLSSDSLASRVQDTMQLLCKYYQAESASIILLDGGSKIVKILHEWYCCDAANKLTKKEYPIDTEGITRWTAFSNSGGDIYIEDVDALKAQYPAEYAFFKNLGFKRIVAAPCTIDNKNQGYLCINDMSERHMNDTLLLRLLSRLIAGELAKNWLLQVEKKIEKYDAETKTLNLSSFNERISNMRNEGLSSLGVLRVSVNNARSMRETLGDDYISNVLVQLVSSLQNYFGAEHTYRNADDEFTVLSEDINESTFMKRIEWFRTDVERDFPYIDIISVGYAWDGLNVNAIDVLKTAIDKMNVRKMKSLKISVSGGETADYHFLENSLVKDINNDVYEMYLQPRILISTGEVTGAEALVRKHDGDDLLLPEKFLPRIEEAGLFHHIDYFMLREACLLMSKWKRNEGRMLSVAVNISRQTLLQEDVVASMAKIMKTFRQTPLDMLELELSANPGNVSDRFLADIGKKLSALGCKLTLDNYGSYYSSLSLLTLIQPHFVSIDKDLIKNMRGSIAAEVIVKSFISTFRMLKVDVIAKGVETEEQLESLKKLHCNYAQGYYFDPPMTVSDFESKYRQQENQ